MAAKRTPFAALAAMIAKLFAGRRNRAKSVHWITLFPATARASTPRSGHPQREDVQSLGSNRIERD
jgi:hypothetical protein